MILKGYSVVHFPKAPSVGTSLVVQWLRLCFHCPGHGFDLRLGNRSCMQCGKAKKKKKNHVSAESFQTETY